MAQPEHCVWVLELAILNARCDRISYWEVWEPFNTRSEAVKKRNKETGTFKQRKVPKSCWRIRKYVPAQEKEKQHGKHSK
jgi:hypothetical protein